MEHGPSLHDELLQDLQDTGMYEMATEMGMVQNGQLMEVRLHEERQTSQPALSNAQLLLPAHAEANDPDQLQGQQLIAAADIAAENASKVADQVHLRLTGGQAALNGQSTPKRKKRGAASGPGTSSGNEGLGSLTGIGSRAGSKGLRHFSMKVCEKVESKQRTTYNEVADELVAELPLTSNAGSPKQYDEKNIRRRVYDALNVLMAMDIIAKHKKEILWRGLPHNQTTALERAKGDKQKIANHINKQRAYIQELQKQQAAYRGLLQRNREQPLHLMQASQNAAKPTALPLPFVLIQVDPDAVVEIQISDDSKVAHFDFQSTPFRMIGDEDVLYSLGLHELTKPNVPQSAAHASPAQTNGFANSPAQLQHAVHHQPQQHLQPQLQPPQHLAAMDHIAQQQYHEGLQQQQDGRHLYSALQVPSALPSHQHHAAAKHEEAAQQQQQQQQQQQHQQRQQQQRRQQQQQHYLQQNSVSNAAHGGLQAYTLPGHSFAHGPMPAASEAQHLPGQHHSLPGPQLLHGPSAHNPLLPGQAHSQAQSSMPSWLSQQAMGRGLPLGTSDPDASAAPSGQMLQDMLQQMHQKTQMEGQRATARREVIFPPGYTSQAINMHAQPAAHLHQQWSAG